MLRTRPSRIAALLLRDDGTRWHDGWRHDGRLLWRHVNPNATPITLKRAEEIAHSPLNPWQELEMAEVMQFDNGFTPRSSRATPASARRNPG